VLRLLPHVRRTVTAHASPSLKEPFILEDIKPASFLKNSLLFQSSQRMIGVCLFPGNMQGQGNYGNRDNFGGRDRGRGDFSQRGGRGYSGG
jgi:hypothetical protein